MKQRRTYKLLPASNAISKIYRNSSGNNDAQFLGLIKNWDSIVGLEYAKILVPVKVSSKNSTLTVSSERNFSLESNYIAPMLIDKINTFYGYKSVKNIDFVFKKKERKKKVPETVISSETKGRIKEIVCNISNDELKQSLEKLGRSMAKKGKLK